MKVSKRRITKALISLRVCAGWSAPLLFAHPLRQFFSRQGPYELMGERLGLVAQLVESLYADQGVANCSPSVPMLS